MEQTWLQTVLRVGNAEVIWNWTENNGSLRPCWFHIFPFTNLQVFKQSGMYVGYMPLAVTWLCK